MNSTRSRTFRVALALLAGATAFSHRLCAQAVSPDPNAPAADAEPKKLDSFVVIGSYIPSTETAAGAGASPVVRLDRQDIEQLGATSTGELLQSISVSNAGAVPISNNATGFTPGAASISLRGLGPEATLILVNGRRVAPYPVGVGGSTAFVDLNSIPLAAIDSIEVLKDGASALYGADAVAGVINIRLRRGMSGTEVFSSYGNTVHQDSSEWVGNVVTGVRSGKLSLVAGANYYRRASILNRDRDYSAVPPLLSTNSSPMNLELTRFAVASALGQSVNAPITGSEGFAIFFANSGADAANNGTRPAAGYTYTATRSATFNPNEFATTYPELERAGAFVFGEHALFGTDNVKAYADLSYQDVRATYDLAPTATGDFSSPLSNELVIPARTANPILTAINPFFGLIAPVASGQPIPLGWIPGPGTRFVNGTAQRLAAPGATNPFNPFNQDISDGSRGRLAEFGNRRIRARNEALLAGAGIKGENVADKWNFDASLGYSEIHEETRSAMVSAARFNELVNAGSPLFDPRSSRYLGTPTPYNPFGYYRTPNANNLAVAEYGRVTTKDENDSSLFQLSGVISTGDLYKISHGSIGLALGADFRREELDQAPDPRSATGDVVGSAPNAVTRAQRKIAGAFLELRLPLLPRFELSGAVRHERFFTSDRDVTVPKFAVRWQPIARQVTVRASYSKGFREPSLYELYSTPIAALSAIYDPLTGVVEPEMPITLEGNRRLEAEKSDYTNAGFLWSPTIPKLKGLSLGADFWRVNRRNTVEGVPQSTVFRAFGLLPGGLFPGEDVFLSTAGEIALVQTVFVNVGRTRVAGWDFSASYELPTDTLGRWQITAIFTRMTEFERAAIAGVPLQSLLGSDSTGSAQDGYLEWKGRVNLHWGYRNFSVFLSALYNDGFRDEDANLNPFKVQDSALVNAQVSYAFRGTRTRWLRDTKVTLGVENLFDRDPPRALGGGENPNGYPGFLYTAENQFWYMSLSRKF